MVHLNAAVDGKEELVLQPMDNWRLYSEFKNGKVSGGRIQFVWLFGIIGVFVLLLKFYEPVYSKKRETCQRGRYSQGNWFC
jgi:hypothetical protein